MIFGLFGEVGSVIATAKKQRREGAAYVEYRQNLIEEFGDCLWYFTTLCIRLQADFDEIFRQASTGDGYLSLIAASDLTHGGIAHVAAPKVGVTLEEAFTALGLITASLLRVHGPDRYELSALVAFAGAYLSAVKAADLSFAEVVHTNLEKVLGTFSELDFDRLPTFDNDFKPEEQIPQEFDVTVTLRESGQSYLRWNGVFIGDPLTDNITIEDGYKYHDVFHLSNAAILHWSPVMRALIKQKRKSNKAVDEAQDGGRAIVVEEGLTAWIFSRAKQLDFFSDNRIPLDVLKEIARFVRGYEVEACPPKLWERALVQGYAVFRQLVANKGGIIVGRRSTRTIEYRALEK